MGQFPFPVHCIKPSGSSEFLKDFQTAAAGLRITQYFNRTRYPKAHGRIERRFPAHQEELYQVAVLPTALSGLQITPLAWNRTPETVRPRQALGYQISA